MKLRRPCDHGRYDEHYIFGTASRFSAGETCPGGEFLPEDALIKAASNDELLAELERRGVVGFVEWVVGEPYRR